MTARIPRLSAAVAVILLILALATACHEERAPSTGPLAPEPLPLIETPTPTSAT